MDDYNDKRQGMDNNEFLNRLRDQIDDFNMEYDQIDDEINDIRRELATNVGIISVDEKVIFLTNKLKELDDELRIINTDLDFLKQSYNYNVDIDFNDLVNKIIVLKDSLKSLKMMQVIYYNINMDLINKRIDSLKNVDISKLSDDIVLLINSLDRIEKDNYVVTDWKYGKHKNIDYKRIEDIFNQVFSIEEQLGVDDNSSIYVDRINEFKNTIEVKINYVNRCFDNNYAFDMNNLKKELSDLENYIYMFASFVTLNSYNISNSDFKLYSNDVRRFRKSLDYLNDKLIDGKTYKGLMERLVTILNVISVRVNCFSRYVSVHCGNANDNIVRFDEQEFSYLENMVSRIKKDIFIRKNRLVKSQYDRLIEIVEQLEDKLKKVKKMLDSKDMMRVTDDYVVALHNTKELKKQVYELEEKVRMMKKPINSNDMKVIHSAVGYLMVKIAEIRDFVKGKESEKKYIDLLDDLKKYEERINCLSDKCIVKKALKVKKVKSGEKVLKKHGKLLLLSAGLIAITLLLRKFLLVPAIMYSNVILGSVYPEFSVTTSFFNKILGGMIGASLSVDGIWVLSNGVLLSSSVATTSLLKGLVTGLVGAASSFVPILIILIKELVEKMKIKERKMKYSNVKKNDNVVNSRRYVGKYESDAKEMKRLLDNIKINIHNGISDLDDKENFNYRTERIR